MGNKTLLTTKAEYIALHLQEPLSTLENLILQHQNFNPEEVDTQFNMGFHVYEETLILPLLCKKLANFQNILLRSVGPESQNIPQDLIDGKIHFVTSPFLIKAPGLKRIKLMSDYFVCLMHKTKKVFTSAEDYLKANHLQQLEHPLGKTSFTIYLYWHSRWEHDLKSLWIRSQVRDLFSR